MEFQQSQQQWATHLRNPEKHPAPEGIEERRIKIYQDLLYNNVENFLENNFPVLKKTYSETHWHAMARDFYERHSCHSPYFSEIGFEFLQYLSDERETQDGDPPFLLELAHYEWMELALDASEEEIPTEGYNTNGDLLDEQPFFSPLMQILQYAYPVHQIGPDNIPTEPLPQPVFLIVYRNPENQVKFMEINHFTAQMVVLLQEKNFSGRECLQHIAEATQHPNPEVLIEGGVQTLQHLRQNSIILGTSSVS